MSYLSIEEKIQVLAIARDLAAASGAASGKAGVVEMFRTLKGLVLEDTGGPDCGSLCYAVADHGDGTAGLTVFEGDTGASVELNQAELARLVTVLAGCLQRLNAKDHG